MTDRYARQTYKNFLSGMGGGALIGYQQTTQPNGGDENIHLLQKNVNMKTAMLGGPAANIISTTTLTSQTTTTSTTTTSTTSATLGVNTVAHQIGNAGCHIGQTMNVVNNGRNALGDIGNRLTSAHFAAKKEIIAPAKFNPLVLQQQPTMSNMVQSAETKNNSCIIMDEDDITNDEEDEVMIDESIIDIDELDSDNTQLVSIYVKDIYKYLNQVEKSYRIAPTFLENKIVTTKMRAVLIDWLIQVHLKFHLLQETLYLCVQIIDAYLMAQDVPKVQLQLVGVTAMFLASKYEEMYVPAIDDFVYMTDNTYTKAEIRQMEISILKTLNFMFCKPLPLHFLRRFSKAGKADPKQHTLAKYFMELSLHDAEFSSLDPSYLAASSLCLSFKLLNGSNWNRTLEYYSSYKQASLYPGMQKIAKLVLKSSEPDYKYRAVTNKYGASKLMRISMLPELSSSYMRELSAEAK